MLHLGKVLILFILLVSFESYSQHTVQGVVADAQTKEALPGVTIYIPDLKKGAVTREDGKYTVEGLPRGKFLIEAKLIGYTSLVQSVFINGSAELNFSLSSVVTELNEVVITGISHATELKRSPIPITTISNATLTEAFATNLIDNISNKPGISQISTGSAISKPVIRGLSYNRIVTLYDGIRQEGQQWGDEHGIEIDEFAVERVEIIKGAGSLLYGSDGLGGVIHFLSPGPVESGTVATQWKSGYQTNGGLLGSSIQVAGNSKGIYWNSRTSHKMAKAFTNALDGKVFNSGFRELNINGAVGVNKKWGYSELSLSSFNQSVGLVEGDRDEEGNFIRLKNSNGVEVEEKVTSADLNTYSMFIPRQTISHIKIANTSNLYLHGSRIQLNVAFQRNHRKEFGNVLDKNEAELFFDLKTINYNLIYFLPQNKNINFSVGTSGMFQQNKNRGEEFIIPEYQSFDWGVFAFVKRSWKLVDFAGGMRYDERHVSAHSLFLDDAGEPTKDPSEEKKFEQANVKFSNFSASTGITYTFSELVSAKLNVSRGFRAPNISELASNGRHEGTLRYEYGSYKLDPETSLQVDAGVSLNAEHISAEISLFQNQINNFIYSEKLLTASGQDSIPDPDDPAPAFAYTQGKARLRGVEVSMDLHPHPLDWLHFENSFSLVQAINLSASNDSSRYLPFIPAPRFQSELRADIKKPKGIFTNTFLKIEYNHSFEQTNALLQNGTETITPGYSLWNAGFGTGIRDKKGVLKLSLYFSVNNVFDKAYQNHLSRLKYADENPVTGKRGVFNMGRNVSFKVIVPVVFSKT